MFMASFVASRIKAFFCFREFISYFIVGHSLTLVPFKFIKKDSINRSSLIDEIFEGSCRHVSTVSTACLC